MCVRPSSPCYIFKSARRLLLRPKRRERTELIVGEARRTKIALGMKSVESGKYSNDIPRRYLRPGNKRSDAYLGNASMYAATQFSLDCFTNPEIKLVESKMSTTTDSGSVE